MASGPGRDRGRFPHEVDAAGGPERVPALVRPAAALAADPPRFTESGVAIELRAAGLGSRLAAAIVDLLVVNMAVNVLGAVALAFGPDAYAVVLAALAALALLGYVVGMETLCGGRTLGKAALGLRVVTEGGGRVGFRAAGVRGALLSVDLATLGLSWAVALLCSRRRRRLGDVAAGTMVICEREAAATDLRPIAFLAPPGLAPYCDRLDVGLLDPAGYRLIREVLMRTGRMRRAARDALLEATGVQVAHRLRHHLDGTLNAEQYLVCVASAYQRRHHPPGAPPIQLYIPWVPPLGRG